MKNKDIRHSVCFSSVWKKVFLGLAIIWSGAIVSCDDDDKIKKPEKKEPTQTLLMYMPWSNNLTSYFKVNIADMKDAIADGVLENERVLVFLATSATKASMYELVYVAKDGTCEEKVLKEYENHPYTTVEGIATILNDMKQFAPADTYAMTIEAHGLGWLPVSSAKTARLRASAEESNAPLYHWDVPGEYMTRHFGGTSANYQTDITTLAKAIETAGITMEYILFDVCYMSNVEVAYDLRHATRHIIASTCEIMGYGMPFYPMAEHLLGDINYEGITQAFHDFYTDYSMPCGTLAMTVTSELDSLATLMREINTQHAWDESLTSSLQYLDGYSPSLFYDLRDYVSRLCTDTLLLSRFDEQLERVVPPTSCRHTPTFYSAYNMRQTPINHFCGLTISDPSTHQLATTKTETNWYKATH